LNDLERRNSLYFAFFTEFDRFSGRLHHSGSQFQCSTFGENYNAPCSAVSLR